MGEMGEARSGKIEEAMILCQPFVFDFFLA